MKAGSSQPYPGLRPFTDGEDDIFYGRGEQVDEMLTRLEESRFLAVVGSSGCGKSSLVKAGLLPAIRAGFLTVPGVETDEDEADLEWRFVQTRPGEAPFRRLAQAILRAAEQEGRNSDQAVAVTEATLRGGPKGFFMAMTDAGLGGVPVLLLIDQFEELFRRSDRLARGGPEMRREQARARDESVAFVNLLLSTAQSKERGVPVILTMRSDWIGRCDAFRGLPEAVSESQFLTPRMTRSQVREAIEGPLGADDFKGSAEPALVNRILNEVGSEMDQLPLMQHALMRTWFTAKARCDQSGAERVLAVDDYNEVGGFSGALSMHLDEAWADLRGDHRDESIARHMFLLLCEPGRNGGELTRRLATVGEIAKVAGTTVPRVAELVEVFRQDHRSFLVAPEKEQIKEDTQLDISHEALLRQWERVQRWIEEESESAKFYRRLAVPAVLEGRGKASLWGGEELRLGLAWREKQRPTKEWADRYPPDLPGAEQVEDHFEKAMGFLDQSRAKEEREKAEAEARQVAKEEERRQKLRRARIYAAVLGSALVLAVITMIWADTERTKARVLLFSIMAEESEAEEAEGNNDIAWIYTLKALKLKPGSLHLPETVGRLASVGAGNKIGKNAVKYFAASEDRTTIAIANVDGQVDMWWREAGGSWTPKLVSDVETGVKSLALSKSGDWMAAGKANGTVRVWQVTKDKFKDDEYNGEPLTFGEGPWPLSLAFLDSQKLVVGRQGGALSLWELSGDKPRKEDFKNTTGLNVVSLGLAGGDNRIAVGYKSGLLEMWIRGENGWGRLRELLPPHAEGVTDLAYCKEQKFLVSGSEDGTVILRPTDGNGEVTELHRSESKVISVDVSADGELVAAGDERGKIYLWNTNSPDKAAAIWIANRDDQTKKVEGVKFVEDGSALLSGGQDALKRWDLELLKGYVRKGKSDPGFKKAYRQSKSLGYDWDKSGVEVRRTAE